MRNNVCILFLLLSVLLNACSNNIKTPIKHFAGKPAEHITPSKIMELEEFGILRPLNFVQINDSMFFVYDVKNENLLNLINIYSRKTQRGVNKGQGPGEVLAPSSIVFKDNQVLVYDAIPKKMHEIVCTSDSTLALKEVYRIETGTMIFQVHLLDSTFIATGTFGDFWLAEMNKEGKIIATVDFPAWEETNNISKSATYVLYNTALYANSPDKKRVVAATSDQGIISFLYRTNIGIQEYKQIKYHAPSFRITERGGAAYLRDNVEGFKGIDCDDNYVYASYSGRTMNTHESNFSLCEHLLVYDWDGNPIKRYILDIPITKLVYNKEKNSIYGLGRNPEGVLVEYKL
jgi:hypothetical protein